jgi:hypothetical protein
MADPAPASDSYGTAAGVAALDPLDADTTTHTFLSTTFPTLQEVVNWIDEVSAIMNVALAGAGITTPVSQATVKKMLGAYVQEIVADLCHFAHGTGRFYTDRQIEKGVSPITQIRRDIASWVNDYAGAMEAAGAARGTDSPTNTIGYRDTDESGDEVTPLFQRKAYGEASRNWDSD